LGVPTRRKKAGLFYYSFQVRESRLSSAAFAPLKSAPVATLNVACGIAAIIAQFLAGKNKLPCS